MEKKKLSLYITEVKNGFVLSEVHPASGLRPNTTWVAGTMEQVSETLAELDNETYGDESD